MSTFLSIALVFNDEANVINLRTGPVVLQRFAAFMPGSSITGMVKSESELVLSFHQGASAICVLGLQRALYPWLRLFDEEIANELHTDPLARIKEAVALVLKLHKINRETSRHILDKTRLKFGELEY